MIPVSIAVTAIMISARIITIVANRYHDSDEFDCGDRDR